MEKNGIYQVGDQIVHTFYGVGEITGIVEKKLSGQEIRYYRVAGTDATYYVPVEKADTSRVRPLASGSRLKQVFKTLEQKPVEMDVDYKVRRARIKNVSASGQLQPMVELLRDLEGRRQNGGITDAEKRALEILAERLITEWAAALQIHPDEARADLEQLFKSTHQEPVAAD